MDDKFCISDSVCDEKGVIRGTWNYDKFGRQGVQKIITIPSISGSTRVRHATTSENLLSIIKDSSRNEFNSNLLLKANQWGDGVRLVHTGVVLPETEFEDNANRLAIWQRYGGAIIEFNLGDVAGFENQKLYVLGTQTKPQWLEVSQKLLCNLNDMTISEREFPRYNGSAWNIIYEHNELPKSSGGMPKGLCWIHPEIVFSDNVSVPWNKVSVTFTDHKYDPKLCRDGEVCQNIYWRQKPDFGVKAYRLDGTEVKLTRANCENYGFFRDMNQKYNNQICCPDVFVGYRFFAAVPPPLRSDFLNHDIVKNAFDHKALSMFEKFKESPEMDLYIPFSNWPESQNT